MNKLAIIGGSGLEKLIQGKAKEIKTDFGTVTIVTGQVNGKTCIFLPRHGPMHTITPAEINHRANMRALAQEEVTDVVSISAVGSTKKRNWFQIKIGMKNYNPGDIVIVRDLYKPTPGPTFYTSFENGTVHADMSVPYSPVLISTIQEAARRSRIEIKDGAVLTDTAGPRYETATEIRTFAKNGVHLVGMTSVSEAILVNELRAEEYAIRNATICIVTNYGTGVTKAKLSHDEVKAIVSEREDDVNRLIYQLVSLI